MEASKATARIAFGNSAFQPSNRSNRSRPLCQSIETRRKAKGATPTHYTLSSCFKARGLPRVLCRRGPAFPSRARVA